MEKKKTKDRREWERERLMALERFLELWTDHEFRQHISQRNPARVKDLKALPREELEGYALLFLEFLDDARKLRAAGGMESETFYWAELKERAGKGERNFQVYENIEKAHPEEFLQSKRGKEFLEWCKGETSKKNPGRIRETLSKNRYYFPDFQINVRETWLFLRMKFEYQEQPPEEVEKQVLKLASKSGGFPYWVKRFLKRLIHEAPEKSKDSNKALKEYLLRAWGIVYSERSLYALDNKEKR